MLLDGEINEAGAASAAVTPAAAKQPSIVCEEHHRLIASADDDDCRVELQPQDAINVQAAEPTVNTVACRGAPRPQTQHQEDSVLHPITLNFKLQRQPSNGITIAICMDPSKPQGEKQGQEQEVPKAMVNQAALFLDAANFLEVISTQEEQLAESDLESRASSYATDWSSKNLEPGLDLSREETNPDRAYSVDSANGVCPGVSLQTASAGSISGDPSVDCTRLSDCIQFIDAEHLACGHTNERHNCYEFSAGSTMPDLENVCSSTATSLAQSQEVDSVETLDQFVKNSDSDNHTVISPSQILDSMEEVQSVMPMDKAEEARIRAELEVEIEKDLEKELENKISLLSRKLQQLHSLQARRHSREDDQYDSNVPIPSAEVASTSDNGESVLQAALATGHVWIVNKQHDEVVADSNKLMQLALYNNAIGSLLAHGNSVQSEAVRALANSQHHHHRLSNRSALASGAALPCESSCANTGPQSSSFQQVVHPSSVEERREQAKLSKSPSMSKSTKGTLQLATSLAARKQKFDWITTLRAGETAMSSTTTTAGSRAKREASVQAVVQKGGKNSLHNHLGEAAIHPLNNACGTANAAQSREVSGVPPWTTGAAINPDQYPRKTVRSSHTSGNGKDISEVRADVHFYHVQPNELHNAGVPAAIERRLCKDNLVGAQQSPFVTSKDAAAGLQPDDRRSHSCSRAAVREKADLKTDCYSINTSNHKPRVNFFAHTAASRQKEVAKQAKPAQSSKVASPPNNQLAKRHLSSPGRAAAGRMKAK